LRIPAWGWIGIGVVVLLIAGAAAGGGDDTEDVSTDEGSIPTTLEEPMSTEVDPTVAISEPETSSAPPSTPAPTTTPPSTTPPTTPPPTLPGFDDGTFLVGTDIQPGRYITTGVDLCYWARLKDASGSLDGIIANDNASGQAIVDIAPTDALFESNGCGRWSAYLPPPAPSTSFSEGAFVVNQQIAPGRYQSSGGDGCYWQRTTGFGGTLDEIIANDNVTGPGIVDIAASDVGFTSRGCGDWTLLA
jgi:hypothetical protein